MYFSRMAEARKLKPWQQRVHTIIFEADTFGGKLFDVALLIAILASVLVVMLDSVPRQTPPGESVTVDGYYNSLQVLEWVFTIFFTLEYIARILVIGKPWKYIFSFYGIIDLLSILPTYIGLFVTGGEYLMVIRTMRLLRVFRVLKLTRYMRESQVLIQAIKASRTKITVFLVFILIMVVIMGTVMYIIEAPSNDKFSSIPRSIYWAVVTLTTVGYGDISPTTELGQFVAAIIMIMGYAVIAVPTGIVSAEFVGSKKPDIHTNTQSCQQCSAEGHADGALYCYNCGSLLNPEDP